MDTIKPTYNKLLVKAVPADHPAYPKRGMVVGPEGVLPEEIQSSIWQVMAIPDNAVQFKGGELIFLAPFSVRSAIAHNGERFAVVNEVEVLATLIIEVPNASAQA